MEEKQKEEEEGSAAEEARGMEGAHKGEVPGWGRGQRREAAARRHNIQIMVSPQHPCEVGWKVATIVMPTSQTRPGHRGKCTQKVASPGREGPVPSVGSPPSQQSQGRLQHAVTWTWGIKDGGFKKIKQ